MGANTLGIGPADFRCVELDAKKSGGLINCFRTLRLACLISRINNRSVSPSRNDILPLTACFSVASCYTFALDAVFWHGLCPPALRCSDPSTSDFIFGLLFLPISSAQSDGELSVTLTPKARGCAKRKWWGRRIRPQMRHGWDATNRKCDHPSFRLG